MRRTAAIIGAPRGGTKRRLLPHGGRAASAGARRAARRSGRRPPRAAAPSRRSPRAAPPAPPPRPPPPAAPPRAPTPPPARPPRAARAAASSRPPRPSSLASAASAPSPTGSSGSATAGSGSGGGTPSSGGSRASASRSFAATPTCRRPAPAAGRRRRRGARAAAAAASSCSAAFARARCAAARAAPAIARAAARGARAGRRAAAAATPCPRQRWWDAPPTQAEQRRASPFWRSCEREYALAGVAAAASAEVQLVRVGLAAVACRDAAAARSACSPIVTHDLQRTAPCVRRARAARRRRWTPRRSRRSAVAWLRGQPAVRAHTCAHASTEEACSSAFMRLLLFALICARASYCRPPGATVRPGSLEVTTGPKCCHCGQGKEGCWQDANPRGKYRPTQEGVVHGASMGCSRSGITTCCDT